MPTSARSPCIEQLLYRHTQGIGDVQQGRQTGNGVGCLNPLKMLLCNSNLFCQLFLGQSLLLSVIENVQANLGMIKDEKVQAALKEDMLELLLQVI